MNQKVYPRVTKEKWEKIRAKAAGFGIEIQSNPGNGQSFGVNMHWNWESLCQRLTITIIESGLVSAAEALDFVDGIIQSA